MNVSDLDINFFTYENHEDIPSSGGVYAFFVPLAIHDTDEMGETFAERFVNSIEAYRDLLLPDSGESAWYAAMDSWTSASGEIRITGKEVGRSIQDWAAGMGYQELDKINEILFNLSLFMPPIYVGMTTKRTFTARYAEHVENIDALQGKLKDFRSRFNAKADRLNLTLSVSDLIFATLPMDLGLGKDSIAKFETIAHILGRPTLSTK